jgi:GNAT superfamily N-acetyltransferase
MKSASHFAVETFSSVYPDAEALMIMHWREIAPYQDITRINPDLDTYARLEKAGRLLLCTARSAGTLVGYFLMIVGPHAHYRHVVTATEDLHFVHPDYRGWTGIKLMKFAERMARAHGATMMVGRAKAKSGHGALYARLGYDLMDEVFTKRLDTAEAENGL